jgi:hypothetical protein
LVLTAGHFHRMERSRFSLALFSKHYKTVYGLNGISFDEVFEFRHIRKTRCNHKYIILKTI